MFPPQPHSFTRTTSGVGEKEDEFGVMLVFGVGGEYRDNGLEFGDSAGVFLLGLSIIPSSLSAIETFSPRVKFCQMVLPLPPVPTCSEHEQLNLDGLIHIAIASLATASVTFSAGLSPNNCSSLEAISFSRTIEPLASESRRLVIISRQSLPPLSQWDSSPTCGAYISVVWDRSSHRLDLFSICAIFILTAAFPIALLW